MRCTQFGESVCGWSGLALIRHVSSVGFRSVCFVTSLAAQAIAQPKSLQPQSVTPGDMALGLSFCVLGIDLVDRKQSSEENI
jgi:hypothetical protein